MAGPVAGVALAGLAGLAARPVEAHLQRPDEAKRGDDRWPGFPKQDPALVQDFVGACHAQPDKVRALLAEHPALAKSSTDWGYGDWESGLGAASHTGQREIARMLIDHGARLDLFAATMLGMVDAVRAIVAASPGIEATPGPHGITLLAHARVGKDDATIAFVQSLPGATIAPITPLTDEAMKPYLGDYRSETGAAVGKRLTVSQTKFGMGLKVGDGMDRTLLPAEENTFHPVGAPNVRVTFTLTGTAASRIEIVEGQWFVSALRA